MKGNYSDSAAQLFSAEAGDITRGNKLEFGDVQGEHVEKFLAGREHQPWVWSPKLSPSLQLFHTQVTKPQTA